VYDGVGADTFDASIDSLRTRGSARAVRRLERAGAAVRPAGARRQGLAVADETIAASLRETTEELHLAGHEVLTWSGDGTLQIRIGGPLPARRRRPGPRGPGRAAHDRQAAAADMRRGALPIREGATTVLSAEGSLAAGGVLQAGAGTQACDGAGGDVDGLAGLGVAPWRALRSAVSSVKRPVILTSSFLSRPRPGWRRRRTGPSHGRLGLPAALGDSVHKLVAVHSSPRASGVPADPGRRLIRVLTSSRVGGHRTSFRRLEAVSAGPPCHV
jgi:hypothetical protein